MLHRLENSCNADVNRKLGNWAWLAAHASANRAVGAGAAGAAAAGPMFGAPKKKKFKSKIPFFLINECTKTD